MPSPATRPAGPGTEAAGPDRQPDASRAAEAAGPLNRVEITGDGPVFTVKVDGRELACQTAALALDHRCLPVLSVSLPVIDGTVVTLDAAVVVFAEETRAALVAMGWTPPEEGAGVATGGSEPASSVTTGSNGWAGHGYSSGGASGLPDGVRVVAAGGGRVAFLPGGSSPAPAGGCCGGNCGCADGGQE